MGRAGPGAFDSDLFWDLAAGFNTILGFNITLAGATDIELEDDECPILGLEDTAAELNAGIFKLFVDIYKKSQRHYSLITLTVLSMLVDAKITRDQLGHVLPVYKEEQAWARWPEAQEQIRVACHEYKSATPYKLKDFDFSEQGFKRAGCECREATVKPALIE